MCYVEGAGLLSIVREFDLSSQKELVATALALRVKDGDILGLGSGSTAELAIKAIGKRISKEGIQVSGVPTSHRISLIAAQEGIQVLSTVPEIKIDWAFDGADEVDPSLNMIKGGGAAMLMEKIIAKRAGTLVIIVSEEKLVDSLGSKFAVPVEVVPDALQLARDGLVALGAEEVTLRKGVNKYGPVVTEKNNLVLDAKFSNIQPELEQQINQITGVLENGIFVGLTEEVLVSGSSGLFLRRKTADGFNDEKL